MPPIVIDDYPYALHPRYGYGQPPHLRLHQTINAGRDRYRATLHSFLQWREDFLGIEMRRGHEDPEPSWINGFLPGLDSVSLYSFLCARRPCRYLEIGSGNSTKFARRAIRNQHLPTKLISIDPHPRAEIDQLCDEVIRRPIEEVDLGIFSQLKKGDILFVDHSHRAFMNSDATVVFLDILPELEPGVLVQIHDIYLPWDYPADWIDRHYNEQYLLACYLLSGSPGFEVVLPGTFVSIDAELSQILAPLWRDPSMQPGPSPHGASFWLSKE
jgi:hypothetical protein